MKRLFVSAILFLSAISQAHEGAHGPEQKMAPHGGVLQDGKALMAELVQSDTGVTIYLLTHESKAVLPTETKIDTKTIQLVDAKKKSVKVDASVDQNAVILKFDKSSSYRFNLTLPVAYKNVQEKLTWQFEPQSN